MDSICIFAGTTEGRKLCEFLARRSVRVTACVVSEYGKALLPKASNIHVIEKGMDCVEIEAFLSDNDFGLVIDATHPYAKDATSNIAEACISTGTEYIRVLRSESGEEDGIIYKDSAASAAEYLSDQSGNILITTGSKELAELRVIKDFEKRAWVRVLPLKDSLDLCADAGVLPSHIYAMQGPFSHDMNLAMIKASGAKWLISKESGTAGGFDEKLSAARASGINMLVIGRPKEEQGISLDETLELLAFRYPLQSDPGEKKRSVYIIGIGPGDISHLSIRAAELIKAADLVIGAERMLDLAKKLGKCCDTLCAVMPDAIASSVLADKTHSYICILMSGDTGFYSGTKRLLPLLENTDVKIEPGISSLSYFASKLGISYDDIYPVSSHGRELDLKSVLKDHAKIFVLVGGNDGAKKLISELASAGHPDALVYTGERLGYENERITKGRASELIGMDLDPLSVVIIDDTNIEL